MRVVYITMRDSIIPWELLDGVLRFFALPPAPWQEGTLEETTLPFAGVAAALLAAPITEGDRVDSPPVCLACPADIHVSANSSAAPRDLADDLLVVIVLTTEGAGDLGSFLVEESAAGVRGDLPLCLLLADWIGFKHLDFAFVWSPLAGVPEMRLKRITQKQISYVSSLNIYTVTTLMHVSACRP